MTRLRSRSGQILFPALILLISIVLFVPLIIETARLSQMKIRHQFAMDAALYVEMANYSDFLNRSAYVNGAFPMRIFDEGYATFNAECEGKVANCTKKSYASILFDNGAFPYIGSTYSPGVKASGPQWKIEYGYNSDGAPTGVAPQTNRKAQMNENPPQTVEPFVLFSLNDANHFWHSYDLATEIYKLWVQVYSLLGSVEDAQFQVLKRLSSGPPAHSFIVKSYWLNTKDPVSDASALASSFDSQLGDFEGSVSVLCQKTLVYCGNRHFGGTGLQPFGPVCSVSPVVPLMTSSACNGDMNTLDGSGGLFQLVTVKPSMIQKLTTAAAGAYPGLSLSMSWLYPTKNYFNVDWGQKFGAGGPQLHSTISLAGNSPATDGIYPAVWPDPTPKFQVRQFP